MKRFLLLIIALASLSNLHASDIAKQLLIDKGLQSAITSVNEIIAEIKAKNVKYTDFDVRFFSNTMVTKYHYRCDGPWENVVGRYRDALDNLNDAYVVSTLDDGAIIGFLLSIAARYTKTDLKTSGISLAICSALLTIAKIHKLGAIPYLSFPELELKNNYFNSSAALYAGTFLGIALGGAASYLATTYLMDKISEKLDRLRNENDAPVANT